MQHYSDELKAKILTEFEQKQSVTTLSKQYIISRTTIYRWLKETEIAEKYRGSVEFEEQGKWFVTTLMISNWLL